MHFMYLWLTIDMTIDDIKALIAADTSSLQVILLIDRSCRPIACVIVREMTVRGGLP